MQQVFPMILSFLWQHEEMHYEKYCKAGKVHLAFPFLNMFFRTKPLFKVNETVKVGIFSYPEVRYLYS